MRAFWGWVSNMGVKSTMDFEMSRRVILLNRVSLVVFLTLFVIRLLVTVLGVQEMTIQSSLTFALIFTILIIPACNKFGYYTQTSFLFSIVAPIFGLLFSVWSQSSNTIVNINHYYIPRMTMMGFLVLPLILIDSRNKVLMYIAISVNLICILSFDSMVNLIGVPFDPSKIDFSHHEVIAKIMILPFGLIVFAFMFLTNLNRKYESIMLGLNADLTVKNNNLEQYNEEIISQRDIISAKNDELEQYNEEITAQWDTIAEKNTQLEYARAQVESIHKDLTDSIMYAKNIQHAVLYKQQLPSSFFQESFIFLKAKSHVSGDFYYYKTIEVNNKYSLVVAAVDCTGHGVPGGFMSMLGMALLNEILQNEPISNAADVLNLLRDKIKTTLNQTGRQQELKDGMDMALCIYYPETKELDFAGARNPLCIVDTDKKIRIIKGNRQPIGVYVSEKEFTNHNIQLLGGEMLYLFSDGLQDQFGGSRGKKLKMSNLQNLFIDISTMPCETQKQAVDAFLSEWSQPSTMDKYEQIDDIVLIGMRV